MDVTIGMTVDEFEAFITEQPDGEKRFELINGEVVEKVPTFEHGHIAGNLITAINIYLKTNKIGRTASEARYQLPGDDTNSRIPDLSFITLEKPYVKRGAAPFMPDLAVEVQSPDDTPRSLREKARYYLANGTRLVWLIYPQQQIVETYSADDEQILTTQDVLSGGDVLPGFTVAVAEIFEA